MKNKKSRSYNQAKLKILSDNLCDNIETLLNYLGVEYKQQSKMITMACPIHGGDNESALNLYPTGDSYRGNWKCRTHNCEEVFKASILGFIRGILSKQNFDWTKDGDPTCTFEDTINFAQKFLNQNLKDIKVNKKTIEKNKFVNTIKQIVSGGNEVSSKITRGHITKHLDIPSGYFKSRGYTADTLKKYDVGECLNPDKEMYGRAVVPVYDNDYKYMIGCTGRSIFEKCNTCNSYHNPESACPNDESRWKYSKWKHSFNFKTQEYLYNFWFAKKHITDSRSIVLVESPGNVWRLEEAGIHNSVAIFGSSLADKQKLLIDTSGAMTIILMMDNDEAGNRACEQITKKCQKIYNIHKIDIRYPDIGSMSVENINDEILPQLNGLLL